MSATVFIGIRKLLTLRGDRPRRSGADWEHAGLIEDAAMVVHQGQIEWVGRRGDLPETHGEVIELDANLVTPGFVDAHTHVGFGGNRAEEFSWRCAGESYQEIAARGGGIRSSVRMTRASCEQGANPGKAQVQRLLALGTTTIEIKTGYGLSVEHELQMLRNAAEASACLGPRNRHLTFLGAHAFPDGDISPEQYLEDLIKALPEAKAIGAQSVDAFVEQGYYRPEQLTDYLRAAKALGMSVRLHVDQLTNSDGAAFAASWGAVSADHLEQTEEDGVQALKQAGTVPVLLPGSVLGLGLTRYPKARTMIENGLPVALATDFNPGSSPLPSMALNIAIACRMMRMTPLEAWIASTVHGALALGLENHKGSLAPGMDADFLIWDYEDYRETAYWMGDVRPIGVFLGGKRVFHHHAPELA